MSKRSKQVPFKVSARAARLIGRENVATAQGAITELVKNAYDADATACAICFLRRYQGVPERLSTAEYAHLMLVAEDIAKFYEVSDKTFRLLKEVSDEDREKLDQKFDDVVDLWIVDNGTGMSFETIEERWMVIGTDGKDTDPSSVGGRVMTGAKGIGRFALDRLGRESELFTATSAKDDLVHWFVDWGDFEGEGKVLDNVTALLETDDQTFSEMLSTVALQELLPSTIPARGSETSSLSFEKGTAIGISLLHDYWDQRDSVKLKSTLEALLPPKDRGDFNIFVYDFRDVENSGWIDNFPPDQYDYRLTAKVDSDGNVKIKIDRQEIDPTSISPTFFSLEGTQVEGFSKADFERGSYSYATSLGKLLNADGRSNVDEEKAIGPFEFTLYYLKRSNPTADNLERFPQKRFDVTKRRQWLDRSGGIRLYRDQFRVRPYGEPDSTSWDWLQLGERTAQNPAGVGSKRGQWRVPPQQVAGTIHISKLRNPELADQSNREGIMNSRAFSAFRKLILALIREFERDRNYAYLHFNRAHSIDHPETDKVEVGQQLAAEILAKRDAEEKGEGGGVEETDTDSSADTKKETRETAEVLSEALDIISRTSKDKDDEIQVLRGLATLGTVLVSFTHELKQIKANMGSRQARMKNSLDRVVDTELLQTLPVQVDPYNILGRWNREDQQVSRWVDFALSSVSPSKRRRVPIAWSNYFENLVSYWNGFLAERQISINTPQTILDNPCVLAHEIDLDSVFFNLIINSSEVLSQPGQTDERKIEITCVSSSEQQTTFEYRDNGPGIPTVFKTVNEIFDHGRTSKPEAAGQELGGTGIGMYLVKSVVDDAGGHAKVTSKLGGPGFALELSFPRYGKPKS